MPTELPENFFFAEYTEESIQNMRARGQEGLDELMFTYEAFVDRFEKELSATPQDVSQLPEGGEEPNRLVKNTGLTTRKGYQKNLGSQKVS